MVLSVRAAILFFGTMLTAQEPDDFRLHLTDFHRPYSKFLREYIGCPDESLEKLKRDSIQLVECDSSLGVYNLKEFNKAREAAKKLFDLVEPHGRVAHADTQPKP